MEAVTSLPPMEGKRPEETQPEETQPEEKQPGAMRYCRRCRPAGVIEGEVYRNLYDYLGRLPEEDKVRDAVYRRRLSVCGECGSLLNGMCRLCGCFVELRAAMRIRGCPAVPPRWRAEGEEGGTGGYREK